MAKALSGSARRELIDAVRARYRSSEPAAKRLILREFTALTGYHRKSAIRVLNGVAGESDTVAPRRPRIYDEAFCRTLVVLWEASDRVCGKRLRALLPVLVPALERHGHLILEPLARTKLLDVSAATIDRLLAEARGLSDRQRVRRAPSALRRSVPIRTYADWNAPDPGFMEIDLVAHCGERMAGAFVHTLTLTDIASTWTECVPLLVREGSLVVETIDQLRGALPFVLQGVDIDNGGEFLNETLVRYCIGHGIELTRSRPYRKNDQAWVEQKNGSVVRRLVGYRRLEGAAAAAILARLYTASRLFVNFFQPSFKLKEKLRIGARTVKRYDPPQTPCARLLAAPSILPSVKTRLAETLANLDPLRLLEEIRHAQHQLVCLADGGAVSLPVAPKEDLQRFLMGLSTAWQAGEVRPTHLNRKRSPHDWRTRADPFETTWPTVFAWLEETPEQTAKALFRRLQSEHPNLFPDHQLRTLQRRVRQWRMQRARRLVFGIDNGATAAGLTSLTHSLIDEQAPIDACAT
jgi:hypothetical protein